MKTVLTKKDINEYWDMWRTGNFVRAINGPANANEAVFKLLENTERLQGNLDCQGIHTCYEGCENLYCMLYRRNQKLRSEIKEAIKDIESNASDTIWSYNYVSMTCVERLLMVLKETNEGTEV